jgi:hypothetical protein
VASGVLVACCCGWPATAFGQGPSSDAERADKSFQEGEALFAEKRFAEACPKFAESRKLDPLALGTLLNLARCHEEEGKTATAFDEYNELAARAAEKHQTERVDVARRRAAGLEAKLSRIVLDVQGPVYGEAVKIDGVAIGQASWTSALPLDPGDHVVEATAGQHKPWSGTLHVAVGPSRASFVVPPLEDEAGAAPRPAAATTLTEPPSEQVASGNGRRTLGFVLLGAGAVGLGVGTFFGLRSLSLKSDVDAACPVDRKHCSPAAPAAYDDASSAATLSTIAFGAGLVAAGVGAYFVLAAPRRSSSTATRVIPSVASRGDGGGLSVLGEF